jgi:hypothetical protein
MVTEMVLLVLVLLLIIAFIRPVLRFCLAQRHD